MGALLVPNKKGPAQLSQLTKDKHNEPIQKDGPQNKIHTCDTWGNLSGNDW